MQEQSLKKITRALLSVSDKTGLAEFAQKLAAHGVELISTGGTAKMLRDSGLTVRDVSDLTGFPEMLDGRVKTLHPKVHGGILGIRDNAEHQAKMQEHGIQPIDLVVINLYPFRQTIQKPGVTMEDAIENIDIGGPAMIRSAAKNHNDVAVIVDPADYAMVSAMLDAHHGALPQVVRYQLALNAFRHTSSYDKEIARFLWSRQSANLDVALGDTNKDQHELPDEIELELKKLTGLRYGENPHQRAALYQLSGANERGVATAEQLQGKELSYNNLLDSDGAWELVRELHQMHLREHRAKGAINNPDVPHTCAIIKHTNPCGVGVANSPLAAFTNAKATDPVSAFGGIIAFSGLVDEAAAKEIAEMFAEVIIAPDFSEDARKVLAAKKNLRVLRMGEHQAITTHLELRRKRRQKCVRCVLAGRSANTSNPMRSCMPRTISWSVWARVKCPVWIRSSWARPKRNCRWRAACWPLTRSSLSATDWMKLPNTASRRSFNRAAQCATKKSSKPPTNTIWR